MTVALLRISPTTPPEDAKMKELIDLLIAMDGFNGQAVESAKHAARLALVDFGELALPPHNGGTIRIMTYRGKQIAVVKDDNEGHRLFVALKDNQPFTGHNTNDIWSSMLRIEKDFCEHKPSCEACGHTKDDHGDGGCWHGSGNGNRCNCRHYEG